MIFQWWGAKVGLNFSATETLTDLLGRTVASPPLDKSQPQVWIVSSLVGGTGSGIFMEVAALVRKVERSFADNKKPCSINLILIGPDISLKDPMSQESQHPKIMANYYARLTELDYFLSGNPYKTKFGSAEVCLTNDAPEEQLANICYLVESRNKDGAEYMNRKDLGEMAAEFLYLMTYTGAGTYHRTRLVDNWSVFHQKIPAQARGRFKSKDVRETRKTSYSSFGLTHFSIDKKALKNYILWDYSEKIFEYLMVEDLSDHTQEFKTAFSDIYNGAAGAPPALETLELSNDSISSLFSPKRLFPSDVLERLSHLNWDEIRRTNCYDRLKEALDVAELSEEDQHNLLGSATAAVGERLKGLGVKLGQYQEKITEEYGNDLFCAVIKKMMTDLKISIVFFKGEAESIQEKSKTLQSDFENAKTELAVFLSDYPGRLVRIFKETGYLDEYDEICREQMEIMRSVHSRWYSRFVTPAVVTFLEKAHDLLKEKVDIAQDLEAYYANIMSYIQAKKNNERDTLLKKGHLNSCFSERYFKNLLTDRFLARLPAQMKTNNRAKAVTENYITISDLRGNSIYDFFTHGLTYDQLAHVFFDIFDKEIFNSSSGPGLENIFENDLVFHYEAGTGGDFGEIVQTGLRNSDPFLTRKINHGNVATYWIGPENENFKQTVSNQIKQVDFSLVPDYSHEDSFLILRILNGESCISNYEFLKKCRDHYEYLLNDYPIHLFIHIDMMPEPYFEKIFDPSADEVDDLFLSAREYQVIDTVTDENGTEKTYRFSHPRNELSVFNERPLPEESFKERIKTNQILHEELLEKTIEIILGDDEKRDFSRKECEEYPPYIAKNLKELLELEDD